MRLLLLIAAVATLAGAAGETSRADQWWLADVGAAQLAPPGPGVPLTLVDTPADAASPELAGRPDTTFLDGGQTPQASDPRGTAAASLAAAPENGTGIVGLYPRALLQLWDATSDGSLSATRSAFGIQTAAARCPGVIDVGLASRYREPFLQQAILEAVRAGCLVVAPAGNGRASGNKTMYPGAYPHVLTVAATTQSDEPAPFSTAGAGVDLAAPGDGLRAAVPGGFATVSGTQYAAALVAAAAALVWTERPELDAGQVAELLRATARDVGPQGRDADTGFGVLDVGAALAGTAPARDPDEPDDDVDQVAATGSFAGADPAPALTTRHAPSGRVSGSLDDSEDPVDLYRIWVPAHRTVRVAVSAYGNAAARIWGPHTESVHEGLADRRRDSKGTSVRAGGDGFRAYVEVLLTGRRERTGYTLTVTAARR